VLLAIVLVVAPIEARRRRHFAGERVVSHKCRKPVDLFCKYTKKCDKVATKCVSSKRIKHCAKWTKKVKVVKKAICKKWKKRAGKCGAAKVCVRTGFKRVRTTVAKCARFTRKTYCVKRRAVCLHKKLMKRCHQRTPQIKVRGPKKCAAGFNLVFKRRGLVIRRICKKAPANPKPVELKTCSVWNDPHITGFAGGNHYDVHKEGDFLMAETSDKLFTVHNRFKRMNPGYAWTGIIAAAVSPNGVDVVKIYAGNKIVLNGKAFAAVEGANAELPNGGSILKKGNNVEVFGPNHAKALITNYGTLINVVIYVPKTLRTKGLCDGVKAGINDVPVSGLFKHRLHTKFISKAIKLRRFKDVKAEKNARLRCKAEGLHGARLGACVFDMMQIRNPVMRRQMLKIEHNLRKQISWGKHHHSVARVVRRRA
jgi:hypothetical protein